MTRCMISRDHPSVIRHAATTIEPPTMNGLLLPHRDLDLSANAPISGAMMMPDNGLFHIDDQQFIFNPRTNHAAVCSLNACWRCAYPAIQTSDVLLFVRPSSSRYGVQSCNTSVSRLDKIVEAVYKSSQYPR